MIYDYGGWSMDITTIFMLTSCKYISFAFCYSDGENTSSLTKFNKRYAIEDFTLLEYFSYIYFYPTCIMGPFIEFADYIDYIRERNDYAKIPDPLKCALSRLSLGFIFCIIYISLKPYISNEFYYDNIGGNTYLI